MKTVLSFTTGFFIGGLVLGVSLVGAIARDENFAKGFLTMAGYNFKTPSETKKEYEAE